MTYIEKFEKELLSLLNTTDERTIVEFASQKVLESYRNGLAAGGKGEKVIRQGKSRRSGSFPKRDGGSMAA